MAHEQSAKRFKKAANDTQKLGPFQTKGEHENEITLKFGDGKELFVPSTYLKDISPVFKAMLEHDFKERENAVIELKGKTFGHVLAFLKCIHPIYYEPVTEQNIYHIVPLAEEYQVLLAKGVCKIMINSMLLTECMTDRSKTMTGEPGKPATNRFITLCKLLLVLDRHSFDQEMEKAMILLTKYPLAMYIPVPHSNRTRPTTPMPCIEVFSSLPDHIKGKVLYNRLKMTGPPKVTSSFSMSKTFFDNSPTGQFPTRTIAHRTIPHRTITH